MGACGSLGNCRVKLQRRCATRSARTRISRRPAKKDRDIDPLLSSFPLPPPASPRLLEHFRDPRLVKSFTYPDPGILQSLYARKPPTLRDLGLLPRSARDPPKSRDFSLLAALREKRLVAFSPSRSFLFFPSIRIDIRITRIAATVSHEASPSRRERGESGSRGCDRARGHRDARFRRDLRRDCC